MLNYDAFYWGTTKKIIVALGTIFDDVKIHQGRGLVEVPLYYAPQEKFVQQRNQNADTETTVYDIVFPAIGFEMVGMNYAPERMTNAMRKIDNIRGREKDAMSYNRVPYDIQFQVYIGGRRLEDTLKILEQVIPFFKPELNLTIKDREEFDLDTNIKFVLNSVSVDDQFIGTYNERREVVWTLQITACAYFYAPIERMERITKTIVEFREEDYANEFERLVTRTNPPKTLPPAPLEIEQEIEIVRT